MDLDAFRWMMDTNYFGTLHMIKAVLPGMLARGSGHIVNISSITGFLGIFGYSAYAASKFALTGFTDALRAELSHRHPGFHRLPTRCGYPPTGLRIAVQAAGDRALVEGLPVLSSQAVAASNLTRGIPGSTPSFLALSPKSCMA